MDFVQKSVILFFLLCICSSCTRDRVQEASCDPAEIPSYEVELLPLITTNCSYSGCHSTGFASGDYTSFEELEKHLDDNFLSRITSGDMPPVYADGPKEMSEADILLFQCWAQAGYPEN